MIKIEAARLFHPKLTARHLDLPEGTEANFAELSLKRGKLFVDGKRVRNCRFAANTIFWRRKLEDKVEVGCMKIFSHGLGGQGKVKYVKARRNKTRDLDVSSDVESTFIAGTEVSYDTTYEEDGVTKDWYTLTMGFTEKLAPAGFLSVPTGSDVNSQDSTVAFSSAVNEEDGLPYLSASITFDTTTAWLGGWDYAEITFSEDYTTYTGKCYPYDSSADNFRGDPVILSGKYATDDTEEDSTSTTTTRDLDFTSTTRDLDFTSTSRDLADEETPDTGTSTAALFDMAAPDQDNVHSECFAKMKSLMLYAVSKSHNSDWLDWFGETAPSVGAGQTLTTAEAALIENSDINDFLLNEFAKGYLVQAFSQSTDSTIQSAYNDVENADLKLGYFWKGDGENCFSQMQAYNDTNAALLDNVYASLMGSELDPYLDTPEYWAKALYEYCTESPTLQGLAIMTTMDQRARVTHLCTLLHILDPSLQLEDEDGNLKSYSSALYEQVVNVQLTEVYDKVTISGTDDCSSFLTSFFAVYLQMFLDEEGNGWQSDILSYASDELAAAMDEYNVDTAAALANEWGDIIADSVDIIVNASGVVPQRVYTWANSYAADNPNNAKWLSRFGKVFQAGLTMGVYCYGMNQCIGVFTHWDDETEDARAQAVINCADITCNAFNDIAKFKAATTLATANQATADVIDAMAEISEATETTPLIDSANQVTKYVFETTASSFSESPALVRGGVASSNAFEKALTAEASADAAAERWATISAVSDAVAKGLNIAALGAACVVTGIQTARDFKEGAPTGVEAMDIVQDVANGVAFSVEAGATVAVMMSVEVCSFVPVIGVIAAVVGIVAAIIAQTIHRDPPPTPEETFVSDVGVPFLNNLDTPPDSWISQEETVDNHLAGTSSS